MKTIKAFVCVVTLPRKSLETKIEGTLWLCMCVGVGLCVFLHVKVCVCVSVFQCASLCVCVCVRVSVFVVCSI
ncbi:unnamed protein product [Arctogadus glacialis]